MAKIIENTCGRRLIKLSTNDIISVINDYQIIVPRFANIKNIRKCLDNIEIFLPEDI